MYGQLHERWQHHFYQRVCTIKQHLYKSKSHQKLQCIHASSVLQPSALGCGLTSAERRGRTSSQLITTHQRQQFSQVSTHQKNPNRYSLRQQNKLKARTATGCYRRQPDIPSAQTAHVQTNAHLLVPPSVVSSVRLCENRLVSRNTKDFYS